MLAKLYYAGGVLVVGLYLYLSSAHVLRPTPPAPPPVIAIGALKVTRGKYQPPSSSYYNSPSSGGGSTTGGRYRSYPSGGGYSGGK